MERKQRDIRLEALRVFGMLGVVAIHTLAHCAPAAHGTPGWWVFQAVLLIAFAGNGIFFMLSGRFSLAAAGDSPAAFYRKRAVGLLLPFFICSALCFFAERSAGLRTGGYFRALISVFPASQYWFVYVLAALIAASPFLAVMLRGFSEREFTVCIAAAFLFQTLFVLWKDLGGTPASEYLFSGWTLYFLLGAYVGRLPPQRGGRLIAAGLAALALALLQMYFFPANSNNMFDFAPQLVVLTVCIFCWFESCCPRRLPRGAILFLGRYSYYVYLLHNTVVQLFFSDCFGLYTKVSVAFGSLGAVALCYVLSLSLSLVAGVLIDSFIVSPLKRLLLR